MVRIPREHFRDIFLLIAVAALVLAVGAGYVWNVVRDGGSDVDFGLGEIEPAGLPDYLGVLDSDTRLGKWASGHYVARAQTKVRDLFIGFDSILLGQSGAVSELNRGFYRAFLPNVPLVPVGMESGDGFVLLAEDALIRAFPLDPAGDPPNTAQVETARQLAEGYPDIHFVYYGVSPWAWTDGAPEGYGYAATPAWDDFRAQLQGRAGAGRLDVGSWSDYFYRTDHHWTPRGAYTGYTDILALFNEQDPSLEARPLPFEERVVDSVKFRGSNSRRSAYKAIHEPFRALVVHDPNIHAYVDGERRDELIEPVGYLDDPPNKLFKNHYSAYYGRDLSLIEYRNESGEGRGNLLIFGDSFSNSIEDLLAVPFETAYRVDLRFYEGDQGEPFDFERFVTEKGITHVLFLSRPDTVMEMPAMALEGGAGS